MSMLTPRGKRASSGPRGGAGTRVVGILVTLLVLAVVGLGAWWFLLRPTPAAHSAGCPAPSVSAAPAVRPAPARGVHLNVYNSTTRAGLAARVAAQLRARGFVVVAVANDPLHRHVTGVAELRHSARGAAAAKTVAAHVGAVVDAPDSRRDSTVDVVVGAGFVALRTPAQAAAALRAAPARVTPSPTATC